MSAAGRIFTPVRLVAQSFVEGDLSLGEIQRSIEPTRSIEPAICPGRNRERDDDTRTEAGLMRPGQAEPKLPDSGLR